MSSLWTIDGALQLNADGSLIYDTVTPLELCCCPCHIYNAIRQRQLAYGLTGASLIDNSGATSYTLSQLIAYVNSIATGFVNGTYSGGANEPTMMTSSYATGAADEDALLVLVKAMLQTKLTTGGWGTVNGAKVDYTSFSGTLANAIAAATVLVTDGSHFWDGTEAIGTIEFRTESSDSFGYRANVRALVLEAVVAHDFSNLDFDGTLDVYIKPIATSYAAFDKQGLTVPNENVWGSVLTTVVNSSDGNYPSYDIGAEIGMNSPVQCPPNWVSSSPGGNLGFYCASYFSVVTWDFDCI